MNFTEKHKHLLNMPLIASCVVSMALHLAFVLVALFTWSESAEIKRPEHVFKQIEYRLVPVEFKKLELKDKAEKE